MSGSNKRYPLDRPPGGMVVEPELPEEDNNMGPNQVSENNATAVASDDAIPLDDIPAATDESIEAPTEVRQAVASMPATGVHFNYEPFKQIAALNQAGRRDEAIAMRDKLDPQSRYVYDNIKNMKRVPASEAARLADEFRKMQDARTREQSKDKANKPLGEMEMKIAMDDIATARNIIQQIRTHKGRSGALGYRLAKPEYAFGLKEKPIAGSAATGFAALIEQADAQVFQQVIPRLRGFGNMTEAEGQRAVRAGSRLSIDISEDDFAAAENDLEDFVDRAESRITGRPLDEIKKARKQGVPEAQPSRTPSPAGSPAPAPTPAPSPAQQAASTNPLQEALAQLGEEEVIRGRDGKDVRVRMIKKPDGTIRYVPVGPVQQQ